MNAWRRASWASECARMWTSFMHMTVIRMWLNLRPQNITQKVATRNHYSGRDYLLWAKTCSYSESETALVTFVNFSSHGCCGQLHMCTTQEQWARPSWSMLHTGWSSTRCRSWGNSMDRWKPFFGHVLLVAPIMVARRDLNTVTAPTDCHVVTSITQDTE